MAGAGVTRKAFAQFFKMFDEGVFQIRISRHLRHFWQRLDYITADPPFFGRLHRLTVDNS
jgi:hypothetical protein